MQRRKKRDAPRVGKPRHSRLGHLDRPNNLVELARDEALLDLGLVLARLPVAGDIVADADKLLVLVQGREDDDSHANQVIHGWTEGGERVVRRGQARQGGRIGVEFERVVADGDRSDLRRMGTVMEQSSQQGDTEEEGRDELTITLSSS